MKFRSRLPERKFYQEIASTKADRWAFEDSQSSAFRIISPVPDPWKSEWKIVSSKQFQKSDRSKWPYRLVLKMFEPDEEEVPVRLLREEYKGIFGYSEGLSAAFYTVLIKDKIWVSYSVVLI